MKKIILIFAFMASGYLASNAQTIAGKSQGPQAATITAPQGTLSVAKPDTKDAADKKGNCTDKKECGRKAGTKSCCSKKSEAKK